MNRPILQKDIWRHITISVPASYHVICAGNKINCYKSTDSNGLRYYAFQCLNDHAIGINILFCVFRAQAEERQDINSIFVTLVLAVRINWYRSDLNYYVPDFC